MASPVAASTGTASGRLHRTWAYWELRQKWTRDVGWNDLAKCLFEASDVDSLWHAWSHVPRIRDVFDTGSGAANVVSRSEPGQAAITTGVDGYMFFAKGIAPDTAAKNPATGERFTKNGYRVEMQLASAEELTVWWKAWETVVLCLMGESVDPAEYVNGACITDKHAGKVASVRMEVWFSTVDDAICSAIVEELQEQLRKDVPGLSLKLRKMDYFAKKHAEWAAAGADGGAAAGVGSAAAAAPEPAAPAPAPAPAPAVRSPPAAHHHHNRDGRSGGGGGGRPRLTVNPNP